MALRNDPAVSTALGRRPAATSSTASRPLWWARSSSRLSGPGCRPRRGMVMPSASARQAMVEAVPMKRRPRLRIMADSDSWKVSAAGLGPDLLPEPPHVGAAAGAPREVAGQHRPARNDQRRQVHRGRRHQQRRDGLVAAVEQDHPVDRVGPQHLLGGHGGQVAPEHGRGPHLGVSPSDYLGSSPAAPSPASQTPCLTLAATSLQVAVAGGQVGGGVAMAICACLPKAWPGSLCRIHARWM